MTRANQICVNVYCESTATVALPDGNNVQLVQQTTYPADDTVNLTVKPDTTSVFTLSLRIPKWSTQTLVRVNGERVDDVQPGAYKRITRTWKKDDRVEMRLDLRGRLNRQDGHLAISRGPIALARDSRFDDGVVDESVSLEEHDGYVDLEPSDVTPEGVWMAFAVPMRLGTNLEATLQPPTRVHLCDFASAGNTWQPSNRYRAWLPETLDVTKKRK